jgi:hypothetical protein
VLHDVGGGAAALGTAPGEGAGREEDERLLVAPRADRCARRAISSTASQSIHRRNAALSPRSCSGDRRRNFSVSITTSSRSSPLAAYRSDASWIPRCASISWIRFSDRSIARIAPAISAR